MTEDDYKFIWDYDRPVEDNLVKAYNKLLESIRYVGNAAVASISGESGWDRVSGRDVPYTLGNYFREMQDELKSLKTSMSGNVAETERTLHSISTSVDKLTSALELHADTFADVLSRGLKYEILETLKRENEKLLKEKLDAVRLLKEHGIEYTVENS